MQQLITFVEQLSRVDSAVIPVVVSPIQVLIIVVPTVASVLFGLFVALWKPSTLKNLSRLVVRLWLPLLAMSLGMVAAWWVWRNFAPRPSATAVETGEVAWSMARGGVGRRGVVPGSGDPGPGPIAWTTAPTERNFLSSACVVGNRLYATTADLGVFKSSGAILELDADSGAIIHRIEPDGYRPTYSSPVVDGRWLVVGEGLHTTKDARITVIDRGDGTTIPRVAWMYATGEHVESTPAVGQGILVIGAGMDGYYAFDIAQPDPAKPKPRWHHVGERFIDCEGNPLIVGDRVYVVLGNGGQALVCLDLKTGVEHWRVDTPYPCFAGPTLGPDGLILIGMGVGDFVNTAEVLRANEVQRLTTAKAPQAEIDAAFARLSPAGAVWAVRPDGQVAWKFATATTVLAAPISDGTGVWLAASAGVVHHLAADGRELARRDLHEAVKASAALGDAVLYVATAGGRVVALDSGSLEISWAQDVAGADPLFVSSPVVARGRIIIGTPGQGLIAFGAATTPDPTTVSWNGDQGKPGGTGHVDRLPLPAQGDLIGNWPDGQTPDTPGALTPTAIAPIADGMLVATDGPEPALTRVAADGSTTWRIRLTTAARRIAVGGGAVVVVDDAGVHRVDPADGHALDGATRWTPSAEEKPTRLCLGRTWIAVGTDHGTVDYRPLSGPTDVAVAPEAGPGVPAATDVAWSAHLDGAVTGLDIDGPRLVAGGGHAVVLVDRPSGAELWWADLGTPVIAGPVVDGLRVLVGTGRGLVALNLVDGTLIGSFHAPERPVDQDWLVVSGDLIACPAGGDLLLLDRLSGAQRATHAAPLAPPLAVGGMLYAWLATGLVRIDPAKPDQASAWTDTTWLPRPTATPFAQGGRVVAGVGGYGVVRLGAPR